jgi:MFS family permease
VNDEPRSGYRALLAIPAARRLALASVPADFADWLDYAAVIALLVFAWDEGPFILALFAFCLTLPYVVAGPLLAVLVDRVSLQRVLILSNLGRGLATFALIFAPNTALVLAIVFVRACIDSAFGPARQAAIQATTPAALLSNANGVHHAINQTSKIAGPALGGLLLAAYPPQAVFGLNAVLSLLAVAFVWGVSLPPKPDAPAEAEPFAKQFLAGAAEFRRSKPLLAALAFSSFAYFSFFLYDALIAVLTEDFALGITLFGVGIAASGAGGIVGALLAGRVPLARSMLSMALAAMASGSVTILLAFAAIAEIEVSAFPYLGALALMGGSTAFMLVPYRTIVQAQTPPDRVARVFAAGDAVVMAVMLSAPFIGSAIALRHGTGTAFLVGGLLVLGLGVVTLLAVLLRPRRP